MEMPEIKMHHVSAQVFGFLMKGWNGHFLEQGYFQEQRGSCWGLGLQKIHIELLKQYFVSEQEIIIFN